MDENDMQTRETALNPPGQKKDALTKESQSF
jgi:hypothetical protein